MFVSGHIFDYQLNQLTIIYDCNYLKLESLTGTIRQLFDYKDNMNLFLLPRKSTREVTIATVTWSNIPPPWLFIFFLANWPLRNIYPLLSIRKLCFPTNWKCFPDFSIHSSILLNPDSYLFSTLNLLLNIYIIVPKMREF